MSGHAAEMILRFRGIFYALNQLTRTLPSMANLKQLTEYKIPIVPS